MDIFSKSHGWVTGFRELFFIAQDLSRSYTTNIHDKIIVLIKTVWLGLTPPSSNLPPPGLHSRRVLDTVVSEPGPGLPWYRRVVYVDDQVNYVYTSETQRAKPGLVWMAQKEGLEFWDEMTWWAQRYQKWYNASLNTLSQTGHDLGMQGHRGGRGVETALYQFPYRILLPFCFWTISPASAQQVPYHLRPLGAEYGGGGLYTSVRFHASLLPPNPVPLQGPLL
uniref:MHC class I-like antigen recognition-like domain-containing protein n=1 Tax=Chelydra serpentina TaxID=8475 RepID=A0A8C3SNV2_CHESE